MTKTDAIDYVVALRDECLAARDKAHAHIRERARVAFDQAELKKRTFRDFFAQVGQPVHDTLLAMQREISCLNLSLPEIFRPLNDSKPEEGFNFFGNESLTCSDEGQLYLGADAIERERAVELLIERIVEHIEQRVRIAQAHHLRENYGI